MEACREEASFLVEVASYPSEVVRGTWVALEETGQDEEASLLEVADPK